MATIAGEFVLLSVMSGILSLTLTDGALLLLGRTRGLLTTGLNGFASG